MSHATMRLAVFFLALASAGALPAKAQYKTLNGKAPLVIAHRGASGYLPEHTLAAYAKAIEMGADVIEPDLVVSKDGVLVVRHEPMLSGTTDIADRPEFAARKTTRILDGIATADWFACDFTIDELRTLRAKQAFSERDQSHNGKYSIPTFQEAIDLVKKESAARHRTIAIYPETKHPTFHRAVGLPMEDRLVESLKAAGWTGKDAPVFIQSFEVSNLKYLRTRTQVRLVQLIDAGGVDKDGNITLAPPSDRPYDFTAIGDRRLYPDLLTDAGLKDIKSYADGIGPWKPYIMAGKQIDDDGDGKPDDLNEDGAIDERDRVLLPAGDLIERAHKAGLFVHSWTFRNEPRRLASDYKGDPLAEYKLFFALGIDGVFSDFTDTAIEARP